MIFKKKDKESKPKKKTSACDESRHTRKTVIALWLNDCKRQFLVCLRISSAIDMHMGT